MDSAQLTPAALSTFKHAASMANPKFYELQRLRKSTWDTPRFVRGYDLTIDGRLVLPRGLRHVIADVVERAGSRLSVTDVRNPGREIDVTCTAELNAEQARGQRDARPRRRCARRPTRGGKDSHGLRRDRRTGTSTLVLVDRKALAEQWRARIEQFLGIRPGQVGGGRRKLGGIVDVAMLPSLARHDDVAELTAGYGHVIVDECHHLAAAVYDHTVKQVAAQFWLGLTATPIRRDGLGELVTWQLGPVRHTITGDDEATLHQPRPCRRAAGPRRVLHIHPTEFRLGDVDLSAPGALAAGAPPCVVRRRPQHPNRQTILYRALQRGRNCLVLTRRVAHVETLASMLADARAQGAGPARWHVRHRPAGRRRTLGRAQAGDGVLVIGTTPFIGEGFDAPALDTLFLAAPVSFDGLLIQCAGRVIRAAPGKDTAEVHDYHDPAAPMLAASLRRRMPGYRALGFTRRS